MGLKVPDVEAGHENKESGKRIQKITQTDKFYCCALVVSKFGITNIQPYVTPI
jgi:hypothetical protein